MTKTIGQFGKGIQSLGDGVSSGSVQFARQFQILNNENDKFGDFGQTNQQMLEGFAEFVDAARMSGNMDKLLANGGSGLRASYQNMMLENSALAAATAFNRKQLVQADIQTMTDIDFAGANAKIRKQVGDSAADNLKNMMSAFKTMASAEADAGGIGAKFGNRLVQALIDLQMDIAGGDTNASFGQYDTDLRTILNGALANSEEFIAQIENDARAGVVQDKTYYLKMFADLEANNEDVAFANAEMGKEINLFRESINIMVKSNQKLANMTEQEIADNQKATAANLDSTGALTEAVNTAGAALLKAQDVLTPNMADFSKTIKNFVDSYGDSESADSMSEQRRRREENRRNFHNNRHNRANNPMPTQTLGPVRPRPNHPRGASRWDMKYGDTHNPDGSIKTPVQRALGGFLQSGAFSLIGENGPELMVTDLPAYVKTVDQIAANLGEALNKNQTSNPDGSVTRYYKGGYRTHFDHTGMNLFDKSGNKLYNELSFKGLTRRTYGSGDVVDMFTTEGAGANITQTKLNGKLITTEINAGNVSAGVNTDGDAYADYKISDSVDFQASYDAQTGNVSSQVNFSESFRSSLSEMSAADANATLNKMESEFTDAAQGNALEYALGDFKTALNQLRRSMTHGRVKRSAEYE